MLFVAHTHVADVYGQIDGPGSDRAAKHYLASIGIMERLAQDPNDRTTQMNLAQGLSKYAAHQLGAGDAEAALPLGERSLALFKTLLRPQESNLSLGQSHVAALRELGDIYRALGRADDAARHWREALTAGESLLARFDRDAPTLSYTARAAMQLARHGDGDAIALARKAFGYAERAAAVTGLSPALQRRLTQARGDAALVFAQSGNAALQAEARSLARQSAAAMDQIPATYLKSDWPADDREKVKALARAGSN
jgi:tetratricopeptide (TPR) repeat protein